MGTYTHLLIVLAATSSLLALGVSLFNAFRIEAIKRAKEEQEAPPPSRECARLHASEMQRSGLAVVVVAAACDPSSPRYLTAEDLPSMRGAVPEVVDVDAPSTKRSAVYSPRGSESPASESDR